MVVKPDFKATTSGGLFLEWFYWNALDLDLDPPPELLGFLPNTRQPEIAAHSKILDRSNPTALPSILKDHEAQCFPQVKFSAEFINASDPNVGRPVYIYRPKAPALKGFDPVIRAIENGWSQDILVMQIESDLHVRQGGAITNFERTLPKLQY